ncbi:MAG: CBS domain-containing protein [Deltaproteobacteria bacterium]|nr:MAG: CBS domain-containing protein [Deltaproteobacteria bacterium]
MKEISGYLDITPGDFKEVYLLAFRHARERLLRRVTAREIMTREVVRVQVDTPLQEAAELLAQRAISGAPVVDDEGRVVGVISEKDFLRGLAPGSSSFMGVVADCLEEGNCQALALRERKVADLMSSPAITVIEETPVLEIARVFKEKDINRAPVLDSQGRLAGIVSRGDLLGLTACPAGGAP